MISTTPSHTSLPISARRTTPWGLAVLAGALVLLVPSLFASDHADPFDPFNRERLEGGITDLFAFPVDGDGRSVCRFERSDGIPLQPALKAQPHPLPSPEEQAQIKGLVVILCVHRALTQTGSLMLEPYTYRIHMDLTSTVSINYGNDMKTSEQPAGSGCGYHPPKGARKSLTVQEATARYGGLVANPEGINDSVEIAIALQNDASLKEIRIHGLKDSENISRGPRDPGKISVWTGVRDDPFIFPAFFGTNVVAMVVYIPITSFPQNQENWLIWATSHKGRRQIDHDGRSLRTQNPRFEILNTLPPSRHVAAIEDADKNPSLMRDLGLRFNLQGLAAYRYWDFVPDVMIYSRRYAAGYPNGRLLDDDVAAMLAQFGDTLLLELSYQHPKGGWPRRTTNDKPFFKTTEDKPALAEFPYLAEPWPDGPPPASPTLRPVNEAKLAVIPIALIFVGAVLGLVFARWRYRRKLRRRYL